MTDNENTPGGTPEEQPNQSGKPQLTGRALILHRVFVALTVVSAVIVAVYVGWSLFSAPPPVDDPAVTRRPQVTTSVDPQGNVVVTEIPALPTERKDEFYTFLFVGQSQATGGGLTDTMMLAAYDVPNQRLSIMSLPRDTYVLYGSNSRRVLLNTVYTRSGGGQKGIEALKREVGELTGVTPKYYVVAQWEAIGELVDAIGGVDFDVPRDMYYNDLSQNFKIDLKKGFQHLDGDKAMQLIRWRHNSDDEGHILNSGYAMGDLGRIQTQQKFLKAIIQKCIQPEILLGSLGDYIAIFQKNVETDLTASDMAYFAKSAIAKLDMDNVTIITMPYRDAGDGHIYPDGEKLVAAINDGFSPYEEPIRLGELELYVPEPKPAATPKPSPTPTPTPEPTPSPEPAGEPEESPEPSAEPASAETEVPVEPSEEPTPEPTDEPAPSEEPPPEPTPDAEPEGETEPPEPSPTDAPAEPPVSTLPPMPTPVPT